MLIRKMNERDYGAYCNLLREVHSLHAENRPDIYKRRYGAGTMLYQAMKQTAQEMELARVEMMVWAFNEQAMRFYKKLGLEARSTTLEEKL